MRASHERWDGLGYPDGLSGPSIPLAARIIACCDAFCAMTAERPYRPPMAREVALRELVDNAGHPVRPARRCRTLISVVRRSVLTATLPELIRNRRPPVRAAARLAVWRPPT